MAPASVRARVRSMTLAVWHFVSTAPLTYGWLLVLMVTTIIQNHLTGRQLHSVLLHRSTNIHELGKDPLHVLFSSLLWIDGKSFEPYLLLFTLFLAPAEHWLGQLRWLSVGLSSHILATYISEGILYFAIEERDASQRLVHARDIGVSYFLVGVMAVLAYHIARPWRWGYLGVLFIIFGFPLITMDRVDLDFTAIGHFASILIGLCFYPMTRTRSRRSRQLSPARLKAMASRSVPPS
ncbi:rhomboid-like protein [Mycobacterium intracellulare]|uniref:rhomboid-like protein n=1 Tax=Mycobacterium intracellulare TaxID=1767 RepID=UPI00109EC68B|nr:rhomboid-like protein [Mycobacterium intracellulare]